jgi:2-oxoglutarate dehydrogenase E2 component (dihydrolipoamide succinyltransferase)
LNNLYKENDVVQVGAVIAIIETEEPEAIAAPEVAPAPVVEEAAPAPVAQPEEQLPIAEEVQAEIPAPQAEYEQPVPVVETTEEVISPVVTETLPDGPAPIEIPGIAQLEQIPASPYSQSFNGEGRFYSPLVRNIASQEGISINELDKIPGTGSEGRLTKDDLLSYIQYKNSPAATQQVAVPTPVAVETPVEEVTAEALATVADEAPVAESTETVEPTSVAVPDEAPVDEPVLEEAQVEEPVSAVETPVQPEPETAAPVKEAEPEPAKAAEPVQETPAAKPADAKPTAPASSVSGGDEIIEMDRMRRLIADHMVMSKHTSPHVTSFVEADVTSLVIWREKVKNSFEKREGEKITFTPIFIEAVVRAIKDFPMINVTVNGTQIIKKAAINISMATALPSGNLIVPVIKKADELNLLGITKSVNDLANRARIGKLLPDDVREGTFTITNVGSFGNVMGTPIINQPQVAILSCRRH